MTEPRAAPAFPRRDFLKGSLGASAALLVAGGMGWTGCAPSAGAPRTLLFLSPREYAILRALAARFVPSGGPYPEGAEEVGVATKLDAFLTRADPEIAENFRAGLWLLELGAPLLGGGLHRFTAMTSEAQDAYLRGLARGPAPLKRQLYSGFKRACFFAFYDDARVWKGIGYDGPWLGRIGPGEAAGGSP